MKETGPNLSEKSTLLQKGTVAPDFTLPTGAEKKVSLHDYKGKNVLLIFYPADWSPVCGNELTLFTEIHNDFQKLNVQLLGISVDNIWSHEAYTKSMNIPFPLLADFEPKGAVSKMYGAYNEQGFSSRALFLIDREGVIRWSYLSPLLEVPGMDEVLEQAEHLVATQTNHSKISESRQEHHV